MICFDCLDRVLGSARHPLDVPEARGDRLGLLGLYLPLLQVHVRLLLWLASRL